MNCYEFIEKRPNIGDTVYFIGYGVVEALKIVKITTEETEDWFIGYIDARRPDGTSESIGFNAFGELAFCQKCAAEAALSLEVKE
jgi:hypothetical protein